MTGQKWDREKWKLVWEKWFRRDNLIVMVLVGILLFVIALPTKKEDHFFSENSNRTQEEGQKEQSIWIRPGEGADMKGQESAISQESALVTAEDYEAQQERKLKELLSSMDGVGEVEVMLTFVSSGEQVIQQDEQVSRANTVEKDSEGGNRTVTQYERDGNTVYRTASGESIPYVIKTLNPRVEGVFVVAQGAGDGTVNRSITEAVMALFGVEAHRVKVVPMTNKHISGSGLIQ